MGTGSSKLIEYDALKILSGLCQTVFRIMISNINQSRQKEAFTLHSNSIGLRTNMLVGEGRFNKIYIR